MNLAKISQTNIYKDDSSHIGSLEAHNRLLAEVLIELSKTGLCRVWRNETGLALNPRTQKPFRYGLKGSSDIIGLLKNGRFLAIEVKTGQAVQSEQQKNFAAMVQKFGGLYFVCRSVTDALNIVKQELQNARVTTETI